MRKETLDLRYVYFITLIVCIILFCIGTIYGLYMSNTHCIGVKVKDKFYSEEYYDKVITYNYEQVYNAEHDELNNGEYFVCFIINVMGEKDNIIKEEKYLCYVYYAKEPWYFWYDSIIINCYFIKMGV